MNELEKYVKQQLSLGHSKDDIRQFLLTQGYDLQTINTVIPDNSLEEYLRTYLAQGYQSQQLFDYLKTQGYNKKTLQQAFKKVAPGTLQVVHRHELGNGTIIKLGLVMLSLVIIIGGGFFLFSGISEPVKLLDLEADSSTFRIQQGDPISFEITLLNQGDPGRVDIYFTYTVYTELGNKVIRKQETKAFETTMTDVITMNLPEDLPEGLYEVEVMASYVEQEATASFDFAIGDNAIEPDPITPLPDPNPNPANSTPDPNILPTPKTEEGLNDNQLLIKALNEPDPEIGASYCTALTEPNLRDECFLLIAQQHNSYEYCSYIEDVSREEDCLIDFVLLGNVDLCNQITLPENQILCTQFTNLNYIMTYGPTGNTTALLGYLGIYPINPLPSNQTNSTLDDLDIGDFVE